MSVLTSAAERPAVAEREAIADLDAAFVRQRAAFTADRSPNLAERVRRLEALIAMMLAHREAIGDALIADFNAHPRPASDLVEVLGVVGRARYVLDHLEDWMRPEPREADPAIFGTGEGIGFNDNPRGRR